MTTQQGSGERCACHGTGYLLDRPCRFCSEAAPNAEGSVPVAYEFLHPNGHAIVDYTEHTHVGHLSAEKGYIKRPLVYGQESSALSATAPSGVDWLGLALDLETQAKRVLSQTTERAMLAAANGLRLMGAGQ